MLLISTGAAIAPAAIVVESFNLVIEMLLISTQARETYRVRLLEFQSRNRDAFDFNFFVIG